MCGVERLEDEPGGGDFATAAPLIQDELTIGQFAAAFMLAGWRL